MVEVLPLDLVIEGDHLGNYRGAGVYVLAVATVLQGN